MRRGNHGRNRARSAAAAASILFATTVATTATSSLGQTLNLQFNGGSGGVLDTGFDAVYGLDTNLATLTGGTLRIQTNGGDTFGNYETDPGDTAKNMFYSNVPNPPTRTVIEAKVRVSDLNVNFHGGGIWMGTDTDHMLRLGVINNSFEGGVDIEGLRENEDLWPGPPLPTPPGPGNDIQGVHQGLGITTPQENPLDIILRVVRDGDGASMFYSLDNGASFIRHPAAGFTLDNMVTGPGQGFNNGASIEGGFKVGLYAFGGPDGQIPATFAFDYFTSKGGVDEWNLTGSGVWDSDANWTLLTPSAVSTTARFGTRITGASTITINGDHNVGTMIFDSPNSYTIAGPGTITLNAFNTYQGTQTINGQAGINVLQGNHTISSNMVISKALTVNVANAANTFTVTNGLTSTGTTLIVNKVGPGTLATKNLSIESGVSVTGGTLSILANGTAANTSRIGTLTISGGARLDLVDNDMIITNTTYNATAALIASARNGGAWNGPGLTSSAAAAASPANKTLGAITGAQFHTAQGAGAAFNGFVVADTDLLVKYTYYGDADLNGIVNFDDYARIDAGFSTGGNEWFEGDFDYNGLVNFDDYSLIDNAFNTQSGTLIRAIEFLDGTDPSLDGMNTPALEKVVEHFGEFGAPYAQGFLNAVPEPTTGLTLAGLAGLAVNARRVRRRPR